MIKPFGSWKSPITADAILADSILLGEVLLDGNDLYWIEGRPQEKGRNVLVEQVVTGESQDITPPGYNTRTRVHEYGGGSVLIVEGVVYFSNYADQRIYKQIKGENPQPLTPKLPLRYADFILDSTNNRLIAVVEDHSNPTEEVKNYLAEINLDTGEVYPLVKGYDFYSSPGINPDGTLLAWLAWNHPNMPWDETELFVAPLECPSQAVCLAGGGSSICEPRWSPDGNLYFTSDRTDWWNFYCYTPGKGVKPLYLMEAEFAYPHWVFGLSNYGFTSDGCIICTYTQNGRWFLGSIDLDTGYFQTIDTPYTNISSVQVKDRTVFFIGSSPTSPTAIIKLDLDTYKYEIVKLSSQIKIDSDYLSIPEAISFPTENGETAYAWLYLPQNKDYQAPTDTLPPLLVKSHGGPTAAVSVSFNLRIQYWTSRGFAYLDVNYGGSTGYGRQYRQRLQGKWGIVDVDDCMNAAQYLVKQGKVDPEKLAISGGSAGGYTTLAALTFGNLFKAGASHYGVSDLEALARDTHKFEARYLDGLVGKYPEEKEKYLERSPINFTERLSCPVIFFQGLEDKVVPPNQAEMMVEALKNKGLPVAYVAFAGEQHGFRSAENIKCAIEGEFYFYGRIFGFTDLEIRENIEIMNL